MPEIKIGYVLKRLLKAKYKSLKQVSMDTEIPYSTLYTWYENRQPKDIVKAQKLADYLGVSLHRLLFDEEEKRIPEKETIMRFREEVFKGVFEITVKKIE